MGKLKQPTSLQTMAFDYLVEWVLHHCQQLCVRGSLDHLCQSVAAIKEDICKHLPWHLLNSFCCTIIRRFLSTRYQPEYWKAMFEIIMDIEIIGLSIDSTALGGTWLDIRDAYRFRQLKVLDLAKFSYVAPLKLANFHLTNLTVFIYHRACTDLHIEIIGQNCPKLKVLDIQRSVVTDEGLRALNPCSALRVVDVTSGLSLSAVGINYLLSVHKKLEKLLYQYGYLSREADFWTHLDLTVQCPAMNHIVVFSYYVTEASLNSIAVKFPNLSYIVFKDSAMQNLAVLKSLDKLTGIEILFTDTKSSVASDMPMWESFKELLTFSGTKITTLKLNSPVIEQFILGQNELHFIFDSCPNIEYLEFQHASNIRHLVIPPFQKLTTLVPIPDSTFAPRGLRKCQVLEFSVMPKLETLSLYHYALGEKLLESIMLDNIKFPNLCEILIDKERCDRVKRIARENNLDFTATDCDPLQAIFSQIR